MPGKQNCYSGSLSCTDIHYYTIDALGDINYKNQGI